MRFVEANRTSAASLERSSNSGPQALHKFAVIREYAR